MTGSESSILGFLPRKSILSPVESIDLEIDFQAHPTTPKEWPLLVCMAGGYTPPMKDGSFSKQRSCGKSIL